MPNNFHLGFFFKMLIKQWYRTLRRYLVNDVFLPFVWSEEGSTLVEEVNRPIQSIQ